MSRHARRRRYRARRTIARDLARWCASPEFDAAVRRIADATLLLVVAQAAERERMARLLRWLNTPDADIGNYRSRDR